MGGGGDRGLNSNYFSYAADGKNGEQLKSGFGLSLSNKPVLVQNQLTKFMQLKPQRLHSLLFIQLFDKL